MDTEFGEITSSPLFTFIVGKAKKEITVHSEALASLSPTLDKLINGEMIEAKTRRVDWSEVTEEATFLRLCEYAYVRNYTPPSCAEREIVPSRMSVSRLPEQPAEPEPLAESPDPGDAGVVDPVVAVKAAEPSDSFNKYVLPRSRKKRFLNMRHRVGFEKLVEEHWHDEVGREAKYAPQGNSHPREDFTTVFLGHAELYILADRYGIFLLKELVRHKLATTLTKFTLCQHNVIDLVELIRVLYQSTLPSDAMRNVLTSYVVSAVDQLGASTDFQKLSAEGGDFVLDFWQTFWKV
ncbi:hypothetical protein BO99DRAFT_421706 [Aspergillus violaceofuscus CBS 115571]|uniref:BTB domain-containing protein n=1 Tax=Aspergillus violaceofuscus (strain CBS 115571) TaxID=1450538 RepID=A0A2V5H7S8_ASPV1|nr:hypothetical protein BO99DRAFT_421706 [Aspergillus violaceofuscus CBS 115571]